MRKVKQIAVKTPEALAKALGLSESDAWEWRVRYALLKHLKGLVHKQKITHADLAKKAGTSRTRVTSILNDNLDHVSNDLLIRILGALGYEVNVTVARTKAAA